MTTQEIEDWFNSEDGKKAVLNYKLKLDKEKTTQEIINKQLERFYLKVNDNESVFVDFIENVIKKYNSDKYRNHWHNIGIEPPENLYWFLFNYAEKYGRKSNKEEWNKYGNVFSSSLFFCNGYFFNKIDGQGSFVNIIKI